MSYVIGTVVFPPYAHPLPSWPMHIPNGQPADALSALVNRVSELERRVAELEGKAD